MKETPKSTSHRSMENQRAPVETTKQVDQAERIELVDEVAQAYQAEILVEPSVGNTSAIAPGLDVKPEEVDITANIATSGAISGNHLEVIETINYDESYKKLAKKNYFRIAMIAFLPPLFFALIILAIGFFFLFRLFGTGRSVL